MGNNLFKLPELGLAEFTSLLITNTLEAITTSLLEQEKSILDMQQSLSLSPAEFGRQYLDDAAVRAEVLRLFPDAKGKQGKSSVDKGALYRRSWPGSEEYPAVFESTGYQMVDGDWEKQGDKLVFSARGNENVTGAVREVLAARQQSLLQSLLDRGIPRVHVDHGRVTTKLTLRMESQEPNKKTGLGLPVPYGRKSPVQLLVKPVNTNGPEFFTLKSDITSEIEVTFKTIVP